MIPQILRIIAIAAAVGTFAAITYSILCLWSAGRFLRWRRAFSPQPEAALPPVSILKPLKGTDPGMYESLRSHCRQNYREYEILFGVSDPNDPAIELVERISAEFPDCRVQLVVCPKSLGANAKVSNLAQMLPKARYDCLLVNDSDIRVGPDYLQRVMSCMVEPSVGMVTCLYRGVPGPTLGSRLESLGISADFCAGVLAAWLVEGRIRFGLGSTLAFRRSDLEALGGFEALVDYLADDYELGRRMAAMGKEVKLAPEVVETYLPAYTLREFLAHQLRWARTIRDSRPAGYAGLVFTFTLPWAVLAVIFSGGGMWSWYLLGVAAAFRAAVAMVVGAKVLRDRNAIVRPLLLLLHDFIAVPLWLAGFAGRTVTWRGDSFKLKDRKLIRTGL
jgi:ceramide glucosyltransferase